MQFPHRIGKVLLLLVFLCPLLHAQEIAVPMNVQVPLFLKILTYDRNLTIGDGKELVIGIVFQSRFRLSLNAKDEFSKMVAEASLKSKNVPVRCVPIDLESDIDLSDRISAGKINILYIAPLRSIALDEITSISRELHVITLTGVPEYVESGFSVGIGMKGEKPEILINRKAAISEGADFSSQLLKLAKIIE
jgi:hypothetical protein